jgi:cytochrome c biogenesis factor
MADTFLQNPIFSQYLLPFLLVFFIIFAILERTKLFGEKRTQLNALTAFVIGLILVGAVFPTLIIQNMILFLTVMIVLIFVILLIWGFIFGNEKEFKLDDTLKWILGILAGIAFIVAVIFATGFDSKISSFFSNSNVNQSIITNGIFVIVIAVALALVLLSSREKKK